MDLHALLFPFSLLLCICSYECVCVCMSVYVYMHMCIYISGAMHTCQGTNMKIRRQRTGVNFLLPFYGFSSDLAAAALPTEQSQRPLLSLTWEKLQLYGYSFTEHINVSLGKCSGCVGLIISFKNFRGKHQSSPRDCPRFPLLLRKIGPIHAHEWRSW